MPLKFKGGQGLFFELEKGGPTLFWVLKKGGQTLFWVLKKGGPTLFLVLKKGGPTLFLVLKKGGQTLIFVSEKGGQALFLGPKNPQNPVRVPHNFCPLPYGRTDRLTDGQTLIYGCVDASKNRRENPQIWRVDN